MFDVMFSDIRLAINVGRSIVYYYLNGSVIMPVNIRIEGIESLQKSGATTKDVKAGIILLLQNAARTKQESSELFILNRIDDSVAFSVSVKMIPESHILILEDPIDIKPKNHAERIFAIIKSAITSSVTHSQLVSHTRGMRPSIRNEAISTLEKEGKILTSTYRAGNRTGLKYSIVEVANGK